MVTIQRLERLIMASKSWSRLMLRANKKLNHDEALWIKKLERDNIKLLTELEEALQDYKNGDRKHLDYYIQTRLRWLPFSETNYKIETLLKKHLTRKGLFWYN